MEREGSGNRCWVWVEGVMAVGVCDGSVLVIVGGCGSVECVEGDGKGV